MGKEYGNPPVVSVACEFRFLPTDNWDMTVPGAVWEALREVYPTRRQDTQLEYQLAQRPDAIQQSVTQTDWLAMSRKDPKGEVRVARDRLVVIRERPYPAWPAFREEVLSALGIYNAAASPGALARVGLRYVNQLDIPQETIQLEDFFDFYLASGPDLPDRLGAFNIMADYIFDDMKHVLRLHMSPTLPPSESTCSFTFDLDYFTAQVPQLSVEQCVDWLEEAHARVEDAFEASIKDSLRELFVEGTS